MFFLSKKFSLPLVSLKSSVYNTQSRSQKITPLSKILTVLLISKKIVHEKTQIVIILSRNFLLKENIMKSTSWKSSAVTVYEQIAMSLRFFKLTFQLLLTSNGSLTSLKVSL